MLAALISGLLVPAGFSLAAVPPAPYAAQEKQLLLFMNDARADRRYRAETGGVAPQLRWSDAAAAVARRHSEEMAAAGRLSHTDASGRDPGARLREAGIEWRRVGENVAMAPSVEQIENMIMREPPFQQNHRANVLDRNFTEVGIGVATHGNEVFVTEDFYAPVPGR